MVNRLIESTNHPFFRILSEPSEQVINAYREALRIKGKYIFGVSYALLDLMEATPDFSSAVIIETGE